MHVFWPGRGSHIFGLWAAPVASTTIPEGAGLRPPPFGIVFGAAGAAQIFKIGDFRPAPKPCIKHSSVVKLKCIVLLRCCPTSPLFRQFALVCGRSRGPPGGPGKTYGKPRGTFRGPSEGPGPGLVVRTRCLDGSVVRRMQS